MTNTPGPKLFMSYCWSNPENKQWVLDLATELRDNRVDVILDVWHLREGQDAIRFMEQMVRDPDIKKVALIFDREYVERADGRVKGVGMETQIVTPEIYANTSENKFAAISKERDDDDDAYRPIYYKSRIFIDMSNDELRSANFDQLLRWIYDKPLNPLPPLGKRPAFLDEGNHPTLGTRTFARRAIDAMRTSKPYAQGALEEYLDTFVVNLERFRIEPTESEELDDLILKSIEEFVPYRDEAFEVFVRVAQFMDVRESYDRLRSFFERLLPYQVRPADMDQWNESLFDNFRFIIAELFLYCCAALIKYERFPAVEIMIGEDYLSEGSPSGYDRSQLKTFGVFYQPVQILEHRNRRLKLNRRSVHADLLKQRATIAGLPFSLVMQADFVLYLRTIADALHGDDRHSWYPASLLYAVERASPFDLFVRGESKRYFTRLAPMLGMSEPNDLRLVRDAVIKNQVSVPRAGSGLLAVMDLMNIDKLGKRL